MHRRPLPLRKNRLFSIRFLVRHVIRHPSQRGGERDDVSAGCGVRRRDGWHFRLFDLWPSTNGLFSRQLNTISFENDSELTYGIILTNFGIHWRLRCLVSHNWSANTSVNASRRKWHFFYFLRRRLVNRLVFYFHFTRNLRRPWGRGWFTRVALSCVTADCVCIYAGSRLHTENKDPKDSWDTFNAVFLFCILYQLSRNIGGIRSFLKRVSRRGS